MAEDPRLRVLPDIHGHAKGEHKPFADERPIPYSARLIFLWFYHAARRGAPRYMMVTDHVNYLTFEDPAAVSLVRRALRLAGAGDVLGAADAAGVDIGQAQVVSDALRGGMRFTIGAETDNDPRSRPDAPNVVEAMRPDGIIRSIHFLQIPHPQTGEEYFWPFDNPEFAHLFEHVGVAETWDRYIETLLEAVATQPTHIVGHLHVPGKFGHWCEPAKLEEYENRVLDLCSERDIAIELNARVFYRSNDEAHKARHIEIYRRMLHKAKERDVGIALGSDAHSPRDQGRGFDILLRLLDETETNEIVFPIAGKHARVALRPDQVRPRPRVLAAAAAAAAAAAQAQADAAAATQAAAEAAALMTASFERTITTSTVESSAALTSAGLSATTIERMSETITTTTLSMTETLIAVDGAAASDSAVGSDTLVNVTAAPETPVTLEQPESPVLEPSAQTQSHEIAPAIDAEPALDTLYAEPIEEQSAVNSDLSNAAPQDTPNAASVHEAQTVTPLADLLQSADAAIMQSEVIPGDEPLLGASDSVTQAAIADEDQHAQKQPSLRSRRKAGDVRVPVITGEVSLATVSDDGSTQVGAVHTAQTKARRHAGSSTATASKKTATKANAAAAVAPDVVVAAKKAPAKATAKASQPKAAAAQPTKTKAAGRTTSAAAKPGRTAVEAKSSTRAKSSTSAAKPTPKAAAAKSTKPQAAATKAAKSGVAKAAPTKSAAAKGATAKKATPARSAAATTKSAGKAKSGTKAR